MKSLARAVIIACEFLEFSGEEMLDSDTAVRELEGIADQLRQCNAEERAALRVVLNDLIAEARQSNASFGTEERERLISFYRNFMEAMGLETSAEGDW